MHFILNRASQDLFSHYVINSSLKMDDRRLGRQRKKKKELSEDQKEEIKEAFSLFDTDNDNAIDYHELKVSYSKLSQWVVYICANFQWAIAL